VKKRILCKILWHKWNYEGTRKESVWADVVEETFFRECEHCKKREVIHLSEYSPSFVRKNVIPVFYGEKHD
jgi:hypothetical protein